MGYSYYSLLVQLSNSDNNLILLAATISLLKKGDIEFIDLYIHN